MSAIRTTCYNKKPCTDCKYIQTISIQRVLIIECSNKRGNNMTNASAFYDLLIALNNDELCNFLNHLAWRIKFPNGGDKVIDYDNTKFGTIFQLDMEFFNVDRVLYDEEELNDIIYTLLEDIESCHNDQPEEGDTWNTAIELYAEMFNVN